MGVNADTGNSALHKRGFAVITPVATTSAHYDSQGHLNNAAIAQLFNDMRIEYIRSVVGPWWGEYLQEHRLVVALREIHISYDSEGMPAEQFTAAMRYLWREGKAALFEQCMVEVSTGRQVASAWGLQLLVHDGTVVDFPDEYFVRVAAAEGRQPERRPRSPRRFGADP